MARIGDDLHASGPAQGTGPKILSADHGQVTVPSDAFITHGDLIRDGQDLILKADGQSLVIKGYFSADPHPAIHSPSGAILTPDLVQSFAHHEGPVQYADNAKANDASPVGVVKEVHGHATIHHADGTTETIIVGTAVHEGDVIETDAAGAVNIMFRDNSSFAVSHNAKLAIDEYVFDPHSDAGASNFSMLHGMFVYTSGLIGHQDPDDVHIHTPAGSIGIRGTVIAGNVDTGTVTVVEGAIVLTSNTGEETTLSSQYETAQFDTSTGHITNEGTLSGATLSTDYSSLSSVAPGFFTGLEGTGATTPDATSPNGSTTAPDTTTPATSPTDGGHTDILSPNGATTTADAGSVDTGSTDTGTTGAVSGDTGAASPGATDTSAADTGATVTSADTTAASLLDTTGSTTGDTFGTDTGAFSTGSSSSFITTDTTTTTSAPSGGTTAPGGTGSAATGTGTTSTSGSGTSGTGTGAVTPPPVGTTFGDNPPVVTNMNLGSTGQNTPVTGTTSLLTGITDPDGDSVTIQSSFGGSNGGSFTVDAAGFVTFTPGIAFLALTGTGSATSVGTFIVTDSRGAQTQGQVTVTVNGIDDAPTIVTTTPNVTQGAGLLLTAGMLNVTDPDTAASNLTFTFGGSAHGNVYVTGVGLLTGGMTFTLQDVIDGHVKYVNDGTPAIAADTINLSLGDQTTTGIGANLNLNITALPPLNLNATAASHFMISDNNNEKFGSSIAVAENPSGFDGLLIVKADNASISGGAFFKVAGSGANPGDELATSLSNDPAGLAGVHQNMVIAGVGAFGMTSAPLYIVGSPTADSIPSISTSGDINIVDASGTIVETITGLSSTFEAFGHSVAGIGDINGDGYDDVVIGSPGLIPMAGSAYVLFGGHEADASGTPPALDLSALAPTDGYIINGSTGTADFGTNVSGAGDFDNDGKADFMVSSPGTNEVNLYVSGAPPMTFTLAGANADVPLLKLGDVSGDGQSDIGIVADNKIYVFNGGGGLTGVTTPIGVGSANFMITPSSGTITGGAVGDFNGDGKSDLGVIITTGGTADIYVVYGGSLVGPVNTSWLDNPHNAFHMTFTGPTADLTGMYITSAGDLNGDGLADLAIGLPNMDNGGVVGPDGSVIVVYGQATGTANYVMGANPTANAGSESLIGTAGNNNLSDGTFGSISFSAGAGDDTIKIATQFFTSINGGSGNDTISFLGSGNLDFTGLKSEQISRVENIDLSGSGQTLTLNIANIFDMMESSDTGILTISASGGPTTNMLNIQNGTNNPGVGAAALDGVFTAMTGNTVTHTVAGGFTDYHFGSHTLAIDNNLLSNAHVNTVV